MNERHFSPPVDCSHEHFTAEVVVLAGQEVLLLERTCEPYAGTWALPGGAWRPGEYLAQTAVRELYETTGIALVSSQLHFVGIFDQAGRDPRGPAVSTAFVVRFAGRPDVHVGDVRACAQWFEVAELPHLACDHDEIIRQALAQGGQA